MTLRGGHCVSRSTSSALARDTFRTHTLVDPKSPPFLSPSPGCFHLHHDSMTPANVFPVDSGELEEGQSDHQHPRATL